MKINAKRKAIVALAAATLFCINAVAQTMTNDSTFWFKDKTNWNISALIDTNPISWSWTNEMDGSLMASDGHYIIPPQRIALSAKISGEVVTNWTTTSITSPVVPESERNFAVYRPDILNQSGVIKSNTLATIQWHGKPVTVILETVQIGTTTRTIWKDAPQ